MIIDYIIPQQRKKIKSVAVFFYFSQQIHLKKAGSKMIKTESKEFYMLPKWLWNITRENRSATMRDAADLFMLMMHRTKLSEKNNMMDKNRHVYIHFTYAEIMKIFECGKTKVWQMYKLLKENGLVTVKYQGFGYPMMVYIHAAAVVNTDTTETQKEISVQTAAALHTQLCDGSFTEKQVAEIMNVVDKIAPANTDETDRCAFVDTMYERLVKVEKKKKVENRFGYFLKMLKNSTFKKPPKRRAKPPSGESLLRSNAPSFDLDIIMEHAKTHKPQV